MIIENEILTRIRKLCEERNWSIYRLAKESDVPYSSLNNMFIRNTQPTVSTLEKLCDGLDISMSKFFMSSHNHADEITLTSEETRIITEYRTFDRNTQQILLAYMDGLRKRETPFLVEAQNTTKE